jgi:deoxyribodipyrimidine photo-lyase
LLLWLRNDLRTHDNPALHYFLNNANSEQARKAIFFISEKQWQEHHWSAIKIDFVKRHATALVDELKKFNIDLELINVPDFASQVTYLKEYCLKNNISHIVANSELEFNEQQRDKAVTEQSTKQKLTLTLFESDVVVTKGKVLNQSGKMFKVFTPFKRAWLKHIKQFGFEYLGKPQGNEIVSCSTVAKDRNTTDKPTSPIQPSISSHWPLAPDYEKGTLASFYENKLYDYTSVRDIPSVKGTSGISPYLAAGVISPRYVLISLLNRSPDILLAIDSPEFSWLNEIIWRDFYRHLMFHEQKLCKHQCFNDKYQNILWPNNNVLFIAWCEGKTGYPLVDAAMRQLNQTGWMHNRLRMLVASFLTKHLLIDWRLGEKYFMEHLIDGDLASNNGGWQWAASTGCDAQPYFRIFNPIRQSERFDPNGTFIRKYITELTNIPDKKIHFPHQYINDNSLNTYWPAIVDHKEARLKALAFYK